MVFSLMERTVKADGGTLLYDEIIVQLTDGRD